MSGPTLIAVPLLSIEAVPAPALLHLSDYGREVPLLGYAWLYRPNAAAGWTLIDTGTERVEDANAGRPPERAWHATRLAEALARLGVRPAEVRDVILTHLHHDHCGSIEQLARARWHVPAVEWEFVGEPANADLAPAPLYPRALLARMAGHGVIPRVDGDEPVAGLRLRHLGGHTPGSMAVELLGPESDVRLVLAGDVAPLYENIARQIAPGTLWHWGECRRALARLAACDAPVLPSHDPRVMQDYSGGVICDG